MGLRALGVEKGDRVALLSENRPEWAYVDLATLCAGAADVPIYPNLLPAQVLYVLNDSEAKVVFVSNAAQVKKLAEVRDQAPHLQHVIRFDEPPHRGHALPGRGARAGPRGAGRGPRGREAPRGARCSPEDLATLIYTSGTTGDPKGVMLTHDNIVSNVHGGPGRLRRLRARRRRPLLPAPLPHLREDGRPLPDAAAGRDHRLRGERGEGAREHGRGAAHHHALRAAPLREDVRARQREGRGRLRR